MANSLKQLTETNQLTLTQTTTLSRDVVSRYVCNSFQEAMCSTDPNPCLNRPEPRPDARPFDFIIIGGGTFGAALAEHLLFRSSGRQHRVLVLEGGPFLIPEHVQNMPITGLDVAAATTITQLRNEGKFGIDKPQNEVWGLPWQSADTGTPSGTLKFPGLAYCVGGRSLYWGGWSPELLDAELPQVEWPATVLNDLKPLILPNGLKGYFRQASELIGTSETNDFIFSDLHRAMREQLFNKMNKITDAIPLGSLPRHPAVQYSAIPLQVDDLAKLLGLDSSGTLTEAQLNDRLKLEAPLAVQGRSGHAGFFPFNKFSSVPLLIKAAREAYTESGGDDVKRRLMIVPYCHVNRLKTVPDGGGLRVVEVETNLGTIPVPADGKVIIALGTIESTRLALASFGNLPPPAYQRIGRNLMAHLRSNLDIRIPRVALSGLSPAIKDLETSALFVKGKHLFQDGSVGHFHLQITASGLAPAGNNSEAELFKKVPDIDKFAPHLNADDSHVVITVRGIGEMEPQNPNSDVTLDLNPNEEEFGVRRAYVRITPSTKDKELWQAMDTAAEDVARIFANGHSIDILVRGNIKQAGVNPDQIATVLPSILPDGTNNPERRDGLGTTHHEAGSLWMGDDPNRSVTDAEGKFHQIANAYALGPALFPTIGSPNPMLTGIALARRMGDHFMPAPPLSAVEAGFTSIFDGSASHLGQWQMVGGGNFRLVNRALIAQPSGEIGLLFFAADRFENFTLRLDFLCVHPAGPGNDNSGVFVRFRDPRLPVSDRNNPAITYPYNNKAYVAVDTGYEIQIDDEARGDARISEPDGLFYNRTGAIYKVKDSGNAPGQQAYQPPARLISEQWNRYEIDVNGSSYTVRLNGQQTTRFTRHPSETFRGNPPSRDPVSGYIGLQTHTGTVAFANVRVKKLP
jgi:choline dehydrogenase-like flavoprotein